MFVATIQPLKFQSTLPRGERRHEVQQQTQVRDFNPRSHEGSDCGKGLQRSTTLLFQSTLPRGERLPIPQRQSERILFQSTLPRGERRSRSVYSLCHYAISIHAPTRGATRCSYKLTNMSLISIHAPTRGATFSRRLKTSLTAISIHAPTRGATIYDS